jgi:periplasmic divalent cation tolerance protein
MQSEKTPIPVRVVLVTTPDRESALTLARTLLEEGRVACGNILPGMTSVYRWKGELQQDSEALLVLKTHEGMVDELASRIAELHPYDVPEVLAVPVSGGFSPYLDWVLAETVGRRETHIE